MKTFATFYDALAFVRREAREHCHAFQRAHIVRQGKAFAIAIVSVNTGAIASYVRD
jgi:hypothetical protein